MDVYGVTSTDLICVNKNYAKHPGGINKQGQVGNTSRLMLAHLVHATNMYDIPGLLIKDCPTQLLTPRPYSMATTG